jgi:hypothetical protein
MGKNALIRSGEDAGEPEGFGANMKLSRYIEVLSGHLALYGDSEVLFQDGDHNDEQTAPRLWADVIDVSQSTENVFCLIEIGNEPR